MSEEAVTNRTEVGLLLEQPGMFKAFGLVLSARLQTFTITLTRVKHTDVGMRKCHKEEKKTRQGEDAMLSGTVGEAQRQVENKPGRVDFEEHGPRNVDLSTKAVDVIGGMLVLKRPAWLLLLFVCSFSPVADAYKSVNVTLEIENPCWFHKVEDPVLVCTVESLDFLILWRRDWNFLVYDKQIFDDDSRLALTRTIRDNSREESLRFPFDDALPLVKEETQFLCENQGYQSRIFTFSIPDYKECISCSNITGSRTSLSDVNAPKGSIKLDVEDPCWYYSDSGPVFVCTTPGTEDNIDWLLGEKQLEVSESGNNCSCDGHLPYCKCNYPVAHSGLRQEKLMLSEQRAQQLIEMKIEVMCETKAGNRSRPLVLTIPDWRMCKKCSYSLSTGFGITSPVSEPFPETTILGLTQRETSNTRSTYLRRRLTVVGTCSVVLICVTLIVFWVVCVVSRHPRRNNYQAPGTVTA